MQLTYKFVLIVPSTALLLQCRHLQVKVFNGHLKVLFCLLKVSLYLKWESKITLTWFFIMTLSMTYICSHLKVVAIHEESSTGGRIWISWKLFLRETNRANHEEGKKWQVRWMTGRIHQSAAWMDRWMEAQECKAWRLHYGKTECVNSSEMMEKSWRLHRKRTQHDTKNELWVKHT